MARGTAEESVDLFFENQFEVGEWLHRQFLGAFGFETEVSDDQTAFVLAHEMAHHDLGHRDLFSGRKALLRPLPAGANTALLPRARPWGWQRARHYLPIRDRKEALLRRIELKV